VRVLPSLSSSCSWRTRSSLDCSSGNVTNFVKNSVPRPLARRANIRVMDRKCAFCDEEFAFKKSAGWMAVGSDRLPVAGTQVVNRLAMRSFPVPVSPEEHCRIRRATVSTCPELI